EVFREIIGLDQEDAEDVCRTRPKEEFDVVVKRFMRDLVQKDKVNSRMNSEEIKRYARPLEALPGVTVKRVEAESLLPNTRKSKKPRGKKPKKPEKARYVRYEEDIFSALRALGNDKLSSLYHSICSIELEHHTPIVAVGMWSFFET